jgi:hypothetical protein
MTWFSWGVVGQGRCQLGFRRARGNDSKRERLSLSLFPSPCCLGGGRGLLGFVSGLGFHCGHGVVGPCVLGYYGRRPCYVRVST